MIIVHNCIEISFIWLKNFEKFLLSDPKAVKIIIIRNKVSIVSRFVETLLDLCYCESTLREGG